MQFTRTTMKKQGPGSRGFTLIELLVVIGILTILIGILVPVVGKVRQAGYVTRSTAMISTLQTAIEHYHQDHRAYPGPLSNDQIYGNAARTNLYVRSDDDFALNTWPAVHLAMVSMSENLTLGLTGGLEVNTANGRVYFRPGLVGAGPRILSGNRTNQVGRAYLDTPGLRLSPNRAGTIDLSSPDQYAGHFRDDVGGANDSIIPEFLDNFPDPLPILYLRARVGAAGVVSDVFGLGFGPTGDSQYDLNQVFGYTSSEIGVGKSQIEHVNAVGPFPPHGYRTAHAAASMEPTAGPNYHYPYDLQAVMRSPKFPGQPRQKDGYVLIGAGPDRIYGTNDDITNFGKLKD